MDKITINGWTLEISQEGEKVRIRIFADKEVSFDDAMTIEEIDEQLTTKEHPGGIVGLY